MTMPYCRITYWRGHPVPFVEIWTPQLECSGEISYVYVVLGHKPTPDSPEHWQKILKDAITLSMDVVDHAAATEWGAFNGVGGFGDT